ncbi:MAG TPA: DUF3667 domain-containing protein, partial [Longimicrobiales bacterium]
APSRYCGECGQRQGSRLVSMRRLVGEAIEDQLSLSGALPRTLGNLLARPGFLTAEYAAGRIARYVPPFRLYLLASLTFFLTLTWTTDVQGPADVAPADGAGVAADTVSGSGGAAGEKASGVTADSAAVGPGQRGRRATLALPFSDTANAPAWRRPLARRMAQQQQRLNAMEPEALQAAFIEGLERNAPKAAFVALPLFALLLKLLYIRRRRMYVEHFVFALHFHAFAFLVATAMLLVPSELVSGFLWLWLMGYLWWAMRRVYRQGWVRTTLKFCILTNAYFMALMFVITAGVLLTMLVI